MRDEGKLTYTIDPRIGACNKNIRAIIAQVALAIIVEGERRRIMYEHSKEVALFKEGSEQLWQRL